MSDSDAFQSLPIHLADLARRHAVDVAIDVGANEGQWAGELRAAGFKGLIFSFEPARASFAALERRAALDPEWVVERIALGAAPGQLELRETRNSVFVSALEPSDYARALFPKGIEEIGMEEVAVERLDELVKRLPDYDPSWRILLKIDVQGLDLTVFEGASGLLDRVWLLQAECSVRALYEGAPDWFESLSVFRSAGFEPAGFYPVVEAYPYRAWTEFDCLLTRHGPIDRGRTSGEVLSPGQLPVSVIVSTCEDTPALHKLLNGLRREVDDQRGELVLVISGSEEVFSQNVRLALKKVCDQVIFEPREGRSYALNTAISKSRGEIIALTVHGAEPHPGWLSALIAPLQADDCAPNLMGCGGPVIPQLPDGSQEWFQALLREDGFHLVGMGQDLGSATRLYDLSVENESPLGFNCAYRREVFNAYHYALGLSSDSEEVVLGGEHLLMGRMLLRDGYSIAWVPEAVVGHLLNESYTGSRHVLRGCFLAGIESVRIERALGRFRSRPVGTARRKVWKLEWKLFKRRLLMGFRLPKIEWIIHKGQIAHRRGRLHEFRRS